MENPGLRLKLTKADNFAVENILTHVCKNSAELLASFQVGVKHKVVASTKMNSYSSRSHTIFSINIESFDRANPVRKYSLILQDHVITSTLQLVDLAGSERQNYIIHENGKMSKERYVYRKRLTHF